VEPTLTVPADGSVPGLLLRPWTEQDAAVMVAAHSDVAMRRWLRNSITSQEAALRVIETRRADRLAGRAFSFAVAEVDADGTAGSPVGSVAIRGLGEAATSGAVGYWVVAAARGRGIAPRALNAACQWVFRLPSTRLVQRLELIHSVGNFASCRVADKAGFALAAVLPPLPPEFPDRGHLHIRRASPGGPGTPAPSRPAPPGRR
jgi:RimJ/RimL family protein N-acetyltransferase